MKKNKEKNGFLITCISCIVLLLVMFYFGFSDSLKGTRACSWDPWSHKYVGDDCEVNDDGQTEIPSSSSTPSSSPKPASSSSPASSSKPASSSSSWGEMVDKDQCEANGHKWVDGICINAPSSSSTGGGSCSICNSMPVGAQGVCPAGEVVVGCDCGTGEALCGKKSSDSGDSGDSDTDVVDSTTNKHSNGSYTISVKKNDGSVLQYNYDSQGRLMSIITTDAKGNQNVDTTKYSNLDGSVINYYNNYAECYYMAQDSSGDCVSYKDTYITKGFAKNIVYYDEDLCKQTTGGECKANYDEETGKWTYTAEDCVCEEDDSCVDEPTPKPTNPTNPTIPESTVPSGSTNKPTSSSSGENVTDNPQTGQIAIFVVWVVALASIIYSIWYFRKVRESN